MNDFLIIGAHCSIMYVIILNTYLAFKEFTRERPLTFLELFLYTEKNNDSILKVIKEESSKTQIKNFEYSQRIVNRIKKLIENERQNKPPIA